MYNINGWWESVKNAVLTVRFDRYDDDGDDDLSQGYLYESERKRLKWSSNLFATMSHSFTSAITSLRLLTFWRKVIYSNWWFTCFLWIYFNVWSILMVCQPIYSYFMFTGSGIAFIEHLQCFFYNSFERVFYRFLFDIKIFFYLIQTICTHLYGFKFSYLILIIIWFQVIIWLLIIIWLQVIIPIQSFHCSNQIRVVYSNVFTIFFFIINVVCEPYMALKCVARNTKRLIWVSKLSIVTNS